MNRFTWKCPARLAFAILIPACGCMPSGRLDALRPHIAQLAEIRTATGDPAPPGQGTAESVEVDWLGVADLADGRYAELNDDWTSDARVFTCGEFDAPAESPKHPGPLPSFWGTVRRDLGRLPQDLWGDTKKVYANRTNLLILGTAYGASLALQETGPDNTVEDRYGEGRHTFPKPTRDALGALGNPGTHFGLAGLWYLVGQQTDDEKTYQVGRKLFSALTITGLSTLAGKAATWDRNPNGEWGAFPSGHTSSTFALASVLHEEYGPWVGYPLYGLGTLVAVARLDDEEHYLSDVVFGGVLGLVVGHSVARDEPIELFGGTIQPFADPARGATGLAWVRHIK